MGKKYEATIRVEYLVTFEDDDEETEGIPDRQDLQLMAHEAFDEFYVPTDEDGVEHMGTEVVGEIVEVGTRV